jgi:hypothetical protein
VLAGALLADLVLADRLAVGGGTLRVCDPRPADDELDTAVLTQILSEPNHTAVSTWLAFLGQEAIEQVGRRVAQLGLVKRQSVRRMWTTPVCYPALSAEAGLPVVHLQQAVWRAERMSLYGMTLAALVSAAGLSRAVWFDGDPTRYLSDLRAALPRPLFDLVAHTEAAVANAVITHRS